MRDDGHIAGNVPRHDRWLRFDPATEAVHEKERGASRRRHLALMILLGLVFYNLYNLTAFILMPDIAWLTVACRVGLVTPFSLALAWLVMWVPPVWREWLVLLGMVNAFAIPLGFFWFTESPLGAYAFSEQVLTLIFGNLLLALRFRHACAFTGGVLVLAGVAALGKAGLAPGLGLALVIQFFTAGSFALIGNYVVERRRCRDFVMALRARMSASHAEAFSRELEALSNTDALTGLPNRRRLDAAVDQAFATEQPLALMMIDVDYFKVFNDTHGHQAGDACLQAIGGALQAFAQARGLFCARYGGEEFTLLASQPDAATLTQLCRDVVGAVHDLALAHPTRPDPIKRVTISMGVAATLPEDSGRPGDLFAEADAALYAAKSQGRNQFCMSDRLAAHAMRPATRRVGDGGAL